MGVNDADSGINPDLQAIFSSGEVFATRINQLKEAQTRAEAALAELQLGQAAKVAHEEAIRSLAEAKARRDEIMANTAAEVNEIKTQLEAWKNSHQVKILSDREEAANNLASASNLEAGAKNLHALAVQALEDANQKASNILTEARKDAAAIIADAQVKADSLTKDLMAAHQAAADAKAAADAATAEFKQKLDVIKTAASTVGG